MSVVLVRCTRVVFHRCSALAELNSRHAEASVLLHRAGAARRRRTREVRGLEDRAIIRRKVEFYFEPLRSNPSRLID
jgi:hypothetical protein